MGLFDDLGVNAAELPETGFTNPKDGFYNFEITEVTTRSGTKNDPDCTKLTIEYDLDEAGKTMEWFHLADNGEVTEKALKSLGFLRDRLISLGEDPDTFDPEEETLIGLTGTLKLVTRNNYQNVRNVELDDAEGGHEPTRAAAKSLQKVDDDTAIKQKVAANRAERAAATKAPVKRAAKPKPVADDDENPFE